MRTRTSWPVGPLLLLLAMAPACSSKPVVVPGAVPDDRSVVVRGTVASDTGVPLGRVSLVAGTAETTSAVDGTFTLRGAFASDKVVIQATAPGFAPTLAVVPRKSQVTEYTLPLVLPALQETVIDGLSGGSATVTALGRVVTVTVPPGALVQAGPLSLRVAAYDPSWGPGLLQANAAGRIEPVQSAGIVYADVVDGLQNPVGLQSGMTFAIAEPPFSLDTLAGASPLEAWDLDTAGDWDDPQPVQPPESSPAISATHFGFWSFGRPLVAACVIGHVRAQGLSSPLSCSGGRVRAEGPAGMSSFDSTDQNGAFCVAGGVSQSTTVVVSGATRAVVMPATVGTCASTAGCIDIGDIDVSSSDCGAPPSGAAAPSLFTCTDGVQIPLSEVCDHSEDCPDGSDEANCNNPAQCCEMTEGCASETAAACGPGCCCCGTGEVCTADLTGCAASQ